MSPLVPTTVAVDPMIGRLVAGRYLVTKKLNEGGVGAIYLAIERSLQRQVALKVLLDRHAQDATVLRRFEKEAMAIARMNHNHIVGLYDFGTSDDGSLFIAMEYVEGESLREMLLREGAQSPARVVHLALGVARALVAAHGAGIVHRDLKPENVMTVHTNGDDDHVKVLDFGLARGIDAAGKPITAQDVIPGTPLYLAPERCHGVADDPRSDLYALGAMMFELLTGEPPFNGETAIKIILRHIHDPPPRPSHRVGRLPAGLDDLVVQLLAKVLAERPSSAQEVVDALMAIGSGTQPRSPSGEGPLSVVPQLEDGDDPVTIEVAAPVLLTKRKAISAELVSQADEDPVRTQEAPTLNEVRTPREVALLATGHLRTVLDRCLILDLRRAPALLAADGIIEDGVVSTGSLDSLSSAVLACGGLAALAARAEAYYGPAPATSEWLRFFAALGGRGPGMVFVAGLQRHGKLEYLVYGDHHAPQLKAQVQDVMDTLRDVAAAFNRVAVERRRG